MPAIKISLNRLFQLFGKSVNTPELPEPVRALAARLMTLTAHVLRVDQKVDARSKALDETDARVKTLGDQLAQLTDIVHTLASQQGTPLVNPPPVAEANTTAPAPVADDANTEAGTDGEEGEGSEDEFFANAQRQAEAEVAAINAAAPTEPAPAPVAVLPARGKKAGGAK